MNPPETPSNPSASRCIPAIVLAAITLTLPGIAGEEGPRNIVVRGDFNQPPYAFADRDGEITGFDAELIRAVATASGLNLSLERTGPAARLSPEVILNAPYLGAPESEIARYCEPHSTRGHGIFVRKDALYRDITDLIGREILVPTGSMALPWLASHGYSSGITPTDSTAAAFALFGNGKHEAVVCDRYEGLQYLQDAGIKDIRVLPASLLPLEYGFGLVSDDADLASALDKGLAVVRATGQDARLRKKWFGPLDPSQSHLSVGGAYSVLLWLVIPGIFLVLSSFIYASGLRKRTRLRLATLEAELAEAREAFQSLAGERARQRFVINRLSTVSLVEQISEASRH